MMKKPFYIKISFKKSIPYILLIFAVVFFYFAKITLDNAKREKEQLELKSLEQKDVVDIEKLNMTELSRNISKTVVNVFCDSARSSLENGGGSGTVLTSDGFILTNAHVIPHKGSTLYTYDYGCLVTFPNYDTGVPEEIYWAYPLLDTDLSDFYDLAFLEIYDVYVDEDGYSYGKYPNDFDYFDDSGRCAPSYVKLGEKVTVFGYPMMSGGYNLTITDGIVSGYSDDGYLLTSSKIDSGNSGGLAVDEDGCMLGVPSAVMLGNYESLGVIIPAEFVNDFMDDLYSKYDEELK